MRDILSEINQNPAVPENPTGDCQKQKPQKQVVLKKRFYKTVSLDEDSGHFAILLDNKSVKTPAGNVFMIPDKSVAEACADEWEQQDEFINPTAMPITRIVNTAIDGVKKNPDDVCDEIVRFCRSDLLFYRAQSPEKLVELQNQAWDPIIDWASSRLGASFILTKGIVHVEQPLAAINSYADVLRFYSSPFALAGFYNITTLTGSALLTLALSEARLSAEDTWSAAHIDEDWNISQWGHDEEAEQRRCFRQADMRAATLLVDAFKPQ